MAYEFEQLKRSSTSMKTPHDLVEQQRFPCKEVADLDRVTTKARYHSKMDSDPVDLGIRRRNSCRSRTSTSIERNRALRLCADLRRIRKQN